MSQKLQFLFQHQQLNRYQQGGKGQGQKQSLNMAFSSQEFRDMLKRKEEAAKEAEESKKRRKIERLERKEKKMKEQKELQEKRPAERERKKEEKRLIMEKRKADRKLLKAQQNKDDSSASEDDVQEIILTSDGEDDDDDDVNFDACRDDINMVTCSCRPIGDNNMVTCSNDSESQASNIAARNVLCMPCLHFLPPQKHLQKLRSVWTRNNWMRSGT
ncbi:hypothetical protein ElyMa_001804000 [Elysia marginata]|uniref:Uncharacterized protein n=1 Tax=Elysia marginata TaxID=1093978 RepID=A0AAV4EH41_9GAST|nr:hypothetical protein ElyMa_001804000 [Elysia marginata]